MTADVTARAAPFRAAIEIEPLGDGRYGAELGRTWTIGSKVHGGLLQVLLTRAGLARIEVEQDGAAPDPLAVSTDFLRAPEPGPVEMHTEVLKVGRTASVVSVRMLQAGRLMLAATLTAGMLPDVPADWADLPGMPAVPPPDAVDPAAGGAKLELLQACEMRYEESTVRFVRGERGAPMIRGWVRPRGEEPDVLFGLLAGDILPPTVFNLGGRAGWAPTVQLTALLRARPVLGWLRLESRSTSVVGQWFDEDVTVVDEAGRLICQARQIALAPLAD